MELSEEDIYQRVGQITATYPLLACDKCAIAVMHWLERWGIQGKILQLKTKRRSEVFITSQRSGSSESITENGTHYGVEVMGKVFDHLSSEGLTAEDWLKDFNCLSGRFTVSELPLSSLISASSPS